MNDVLNETKRWLEHFIIKLGLCPFAAKPFNEDKVGYFISKSPELDAVYKDFLMQLDAFHSRPASEVETLLFITPNALGDFEDYLDAMYSMEEAVADSGLEGVIQLASFHPNYVFDGEPEDAASNYTNRSPYPMIHFLREQSLTKAIDNFQVLDEIPSRNQQMMEDLGVTKINQRTKSVLR